MSKVQSQGWNSLSTFPPIKLWIYTSDDELLVFRNSNFWFDHDFLDDPFGPGRSIAASFLAKGDKGLVEEVVPLGDPHPEIEN